MVCGGSGGADAGIRGCFVRFGFEGTRMGVARSRPRSRSGAGGGETPVHLGRCRRQLSRFRQQQGEYTARSDQGPGGRIHRYCSRCAAYYRRRAFPYVGGRSGGMARRMAAGRIFQGRTHGHVGLPAGVYRRRKVARPAHSRRDQYLYGGQPDFAGRRRSRFSGGGQAGMDDRSEFGGRHYEHHVNLAVRQVLQSGIARSAGVSLFDAQGPRGL